MVKAIIFDCWGTLFTNSQDPHPFSLFAQRLGYHISDRAFLKPFERHLMTNAGGITGNIVDLLDELSIEPKEELVHELTVIMLSSTKTQIAYPDSFATLHELSQNYKLVLLSNTFKEGFLSLDKQFNIRQRFAFVVLSYEQGVVKPDAGLYKKILDETGLSPGEIVMVGDNYEDDILAAKDVGIQGLLLDRKGRYPDILDNRLPGLAQIERYL